MIREATPERNLSNGYHIRITEIAMIAAVTATIPAMIKALMIATALIPASKNGPIGNILVPPSSLVLIWLTVKMSRRERALCCII